MSEDRPLFSDFELRASLDGHRAKLRAQIDAIEAKRLLGTSVDDWCDYLEQEFRIETPALQRDEMHVDHKEAQIDVSGDPRRFAFADHDGPVYVRGTRVTLTIPFTGLGELFHSKASSYTFAPPMGSVVGSQLELSINVVDQDPKRVKEQLDAMLGEVERHLAFTSNDVNGFNGALRDFIRQRLTERREKILSDQSMVASLGFPLKRRADAPQSYVVPAARRKPPVAPPVAKAEAFTPDPTISLEEYENILKIISGMAQVLEKSPAAFMKLDEESLRSQFLVQLNGQYLGDATGETFNFQGKTDILIKHEGKNIFVAECKFWTGAKGFLDAITQLLGYTTWRDTKTALLVFNRNKNFSGVLKSIREAAPTHPAFKREVSVKSESCFRFVFHHPDDKTREIIMTVLAFEVPA